MNRFGITVSNLHRSHIPLLRELNVDFIEIPFHISRPSPDLIAELKDCGIESEGRYIPSRSEQENPPAMMDFSTETFRRYRGLIQHWDFGGEVETRPDQPGCRWFLDEAKFMKAYRQYRLTGKKIDPDNQIGCGGFISATFNGLFGNEDRSAFLKRLFQKGLGNILDFLSFDFFVYAYGGEKNVTAGFLEMKNLLVKYKIGVPLCIVETGVPCAGDPKFLHIIQTEEEQAASLVKSHCLFFANGIDEVTWFTFKYAGWGLIDNDLQKRKSFFALKELIGNLKGFEFEGQKKVYPKDRFLTDHFTWLRFKKGSELRDVIWMDKGLVSDWKLPDGMICRPFDLHEDVSLDEYMRFSSSPVFLSGTLEDYNFIQQ